MINKAKQALLLFVFSALPCFIGCSLDDNVTQDESLYVKYSVEVNTILEGYHDSWCWFHPRVAKLGDRQDYVMLMQPWITSHSDFYQFLNMLSSSGGTIWSNPVSLVDSLGEKWEDNKRTMVRICDVTPQWHQKSKKVLATGVTVYYRDSAEFAPSPRETCYFYYTPETGKWSSWKKLEMPQKPEFFHASVGCSQWVDCPNGDVLLPIYFLRDPNNLKYSVTVLRCHFNGEKLEYLEHGNYLDYERGRGFCEPSLIKFNDKYFLTLRNDINGMVTVSADGLHYKDPVEWMYNDSTYVWTENTQQHWVKSPKSLFLVYTSSHREESANVFRGRAPLFMAQFDEKNMVLMKETERVLIPNNGAALGNFGAFDLDEHESWVTTSEAMDESAVKLGADGRVYIARIKWEK